MSALKMALGEIERLAEWLNELGHPTQDKTIEVMEELAQTIEAAMSANESRDRRALRATQAIVADWINARKIDFDKAGAADLAARAALAQPDPAAALADALRLVLSYPCHEYNEIGRAALDAWERSNG